MIFGISSLGSHVDISFMHWFPNAMEMENFTNILTKRYPIEDYGTYEPGDCSFHHGWLWHAADENKCKLGIRI